MPRIGNNSDTGYSLSNLGYFWAINDFLDFRSDGDISVNGSWRLGERFRYKKSNMFSGEISGEYKEYPLYSDWNAKFMHNQVFDSSTRLDVNVQLQGPPQGYDLNSLNSITMLNQQSNARAALAKTFNDENGIAALTYNRSEDLSTLDASILFVPHSQLMTGDRMFHSPPVLPSAALLLRRVRLLHPDMQHRPMLSWGTTVNFPMDTRYSLHKGSSCRPQILYQDSIPIPVVVQAWLFRSGCNQPCFIISMSIPA